MFMVERSGVVRADEGRRSYKVTSGPEAIRSDGGSALCGA